MNIFYLNLSLFVFLVLGWPVITGAEVSIFDLTQQNNIEEIKAQLKSNPRAVLETTNDEAKSQPIHSAAEQCSVSLLQVFIDAKADVNVQNYYEQTPFTLAAKNCPVEVLEYLVKNGADPKYKTQQDGFSAMHYVVNQKDGKKAVEYLLILGLDINAKTNLHNTTPLINTIKFGNPEMMKHLIEKGADLTIGQPLNEAVQTGTCTIELLEYLIEHGANPTEAAPLSTAISYGKRDIAQFLVEQGADINAAEALGAAAAIRDLELVKFLLSKGADINGGMRTPLMQASQSGNLEILKYLLAQGADVSAVTENDHHTALSLAVWDGHKIVADVLTKNGASPTVFSDAMLGEIDRLEEYSLQELLDSKDYSGRTPLFAAVIGRQKKAVEFLISKGAEINGKTNIEELTPLHAAVETGHREIVRILLSSGAEAGAQMSESLYVRQGYSPLDIAKEKNDELMIKLLEKFGAASFHIE